MAIMQSWQSDSAGVGVAKYVAARVVVVASADGALRQRLLAGLRGMRWSVKEAAGGAEAMAIAEQLRPEGLIVDGWLPDLEAGEFVSQMGAMFPAMDILRVDGSACGNVAGRSPRRNEMLHAIREAQEGRGNLVEIVQKADGDRTGPPVVLLRPPQVRLTEMVGDSAVMLELARLIRLVAPRSVTVLIEGETGCGKEVVAKAIHRLSSRAGKPFVVLNCAAIPESLLEAELFGHTRGAFTGAVQSRTGRIEAAHGGTLFLDEIGEMPLALQAKMLRFLECGELQKVGENETIRVDVRVIAATHQELERRAEEKTFRLDLYHRLAVFPLEVPALRDRLEDLPRLVEFFLEQMGREQPRKVISAEALSRLAGYEWPGNVRELMHVLERAAILTEDRSEIRDAEIRLGSAKGGRVRR
jgi:transcriptional regulator with GAF, ATPase, and Fis domain